MKMRDKSVFIRLWDYLKQYQFTLFLAIFLKIIAAIANVLEPFCPRAGHHRTDTKFARYGSTSSRCGY